MHTIITTTFLTFMIIFNTHSMDKDILNTMDEETRALLLQEVQDFGLHPELNFWVNPADTADYGAPICVDSVPENNLASYYQHLEDEASTQRLLDDEAIVQQLQSIDLKPLQIVSDVRSQFEIVLVDKIEEIKALLPKFLEIEQVIQKARQADNVHFLDPHLFAGGYLAHILKIAGTLNLDKGTLSLAETQSALIKLYTTTNPNEIITSYWDGKIVHNISSQAMLGHINTFFASYTNDVTSLAGGATYLDQTRELLSRTLDLTLQLAVYDTSPHELLAQAIAENYILKAGCIQGRLNRIFMRYAALIGGVGFRDIEVIFKV